MTTTKPTVQDSGSPESIMAREITHGYTAYTKGCRCQECRAAKAAYMRAKRSRAGNQRAAISTGRARYYAGDQITHGYAAYQDHQCRCPVCTAAKAASYVRNGG